MQVVSTVVSRSVEACWRVFTDPTKLTAWVPGLRDARVIELDDDGLSREVHFEFATTLAYSLVYSYDVAARMVTWDPRDGDKGGVRGFASFAETEGGTQFTYALEHDDARKAAERAIDDPRTLAEAFARLMHEGPLG